MKGSKNIGLMISGIIAIAFLLAASGLILSTLAWGTPGTWTPLAGDAVKENSHGWPYPTAKVGSIAQGRYGPTGYYFDIAGHSASRACGGVVNTTWMVVVMARHISKDILVVDPPVKFDNPNVWGYAKSYRGAFYSSQTQTIAEFKSLIHTFRLDSGTAYVFP
ncbi:MAG: hypothetical protein QXP45_04715 [Thermoproteota archaeon]